VGRTGAEGIDGGLILGGVTNQAFLISPGDIRRSDTVTCDIGEDGERAGGWGEDGEPNSLLIISTLPFL